MRPPKLVRLNSPCLHAEFVSYGAALKSLKLIREGQPPLDLIWDLGSPSAYVANPASAGVVVGRVAGRMAGGLLKIGGRRFQLNQNEGENTLHGGAGGFGWQNWQWAGGAAFKLSSLNGDQGFPGQLEVKAAYSMPEPRTLRLDLTAKARATTVVNLTHHPYWTAEALSINGTEAQVVDDALIPQGGYEPFEPVGALDHCVKIDGQGFRNIGKLEHESWAIEVWSDASHAQIYNGQDGYVCIEPQGPNGAPDVLTPGKVWQRSIEYRFSGF